MFDTSGHPINLEGTSWPKKNTDPAKASGAEQSMMNSTTLLKGLSHEMRTHMNAVVAFSYIMNKDGYSENERSEFGTQVMNSCEQLIGLFDNFLDTAIIEAGNSKAEERAVRTNVFFDELFSEFRSIMRAEKYADLMLVTENQFPGSAEIMVDSYKIARVLRNLFQNALHTTKSGYIKIGYSLGGNRLNCYILDSGQGYSITKEFFQTDDLNCSLGRFPDIYQAINIALSRKLIGLLRGEIRVECNGLKGTGIYFSIPVTIAGNNRIGLNKLSNNKITI
ncbi:MAG: HAMP domain-containing histidine kinase [Bacteroidales bacterium]|nr:HAMP domain-containing histidine kinase [Bacteroidales bacterium]